MSKAVGAVMTTKVVAGLIEDHKLAGELKEFPDNIDDTNGLIEVPAESLCEIMCDAITAQIPKGATIDAAGVALPGYVNRGVMLDAPNLPQLKGAQVASNISGGLKRRGLDVTVSVFNDADAVAAGIAATRGRMDRQVRVWTIGNGIGFGRFPITEGPWEGGHMVVTLDPNEKYCGCGGLGHLESIMGHRAMRLRFLDMEPEEVFAAAKTGEDPRCAEFAILWHRALAAATATSIHMTGPGKFYISGSNACFVNLAFLNRCVQDMVKMSPLQGYVFEVVERSDELAVIGAVVNARRA
jgi:predicted NBD/HSP70 family sugar kinase